MTEPREALLDAWAETMMDALRNSDDGDNPFYSDDEDTVSLARQLAEAVVSRLDAVLAAHHPQVCDGTFICCSCGWEYDDGDGRRWPAHVLAAQENPTPHINDIDGPHPESPDWHAGYRAGRSEGPGLDALREARKAMSDRHDDLMWCNKDDDCHIQAKGVEVAIADFDAALAAQENPT